MIATDRRSRGRYRSRVALALAAIGILVAAGPAAAAGPDIDPNQPGSLTITKQRAASDFTVWAVTSQTNTGAPDLTTNEGWNEVSGLFDQLGSNPTAGAVNAAGYDLTVVPATSTTATAETFEGLDLGLYYVAETTAAPGYDPVLPFLVTIPTTDPSAPAGTSWLYDVVVAPKNRAVTAKAVNDADAFHSDVAGNPGSAGDPVSWTIRGNIEDGDEDLYRVTDDLDARLRFTGATAALDTAGTVTPLSAGDYSVASSPRPSAGDRVVVSLTDSGLAKINATDPTTTQVVVTITTTVRAGTTGNIVNGATIQQTGDIVTEVPDTSTRWGAIRIRKESPAGATLQGAAFEVFASHTNEYGTATTTGLTGTTDADGIATIAGIRYSDFAGGAVIGTTDPAYAYYWLVETRAPDGFELLPEAVPFQITSANANDNFVDVTVENVPTNGGFELPLTGGSVPTFVFYGAGALLIIGSAILIVRARRARA